ncbi:kinase-like protein [Abortiporus biennis]|nr:kinase-like protein [Abortiporus biennis]
MSHALLLRLFLSPSFFSVHVALQYLRLYADNIGITYYLTRRLRELDTHELREVWGFICHLLVTRPSKSRALECFVVEIAQKSTHIAMLTLWYMQSSLKDLSLSRHDSESFLICQRMLQQCHEIIFGDIRSTSPYSTLKLSSIPGIHRRKVKPHIQPAVVGIGMVLAGTPVMPLLTAIMGEVAIEQGRLDDQHEDVRSLDHADEVIRSPVESEEEIVDIDQEQDIDEETPKPDSNPRIETAYEAFTRENAFDDTSRPDGPSRRRTIGAQTTPALPLHMKDRRKPRLSEDPFGQYDPPLPLPLPTPSQSTPTFSRHPLKTASLHVNDLLQKYDTPTQMHMLRSHFCRSEVQFILALENICNKLLVVPKPARVSALRAELTALNHLLPAEVCMPMWCASSDTVQSAKSIPEPHHRIVRIPPGESVVLNSAERAPYLLLIEVLNGDLDFDPSKRSNREVLKKLVAKEDEKKGSSKDLESFSTDGPPMTAALRPPSTAIHDSDSKTEALLGGDNQATEDEDYFGAPATPAEDEEEIDLVEQVFGDEENFRSPLDLSESIVLPLPPKNRELDIATWSRSTSLPASPIVHGDTQPRHTPSLSISSSSARVEAMNNGTRVLSLDEYSERMRTAAVMLAQLNANLSRDSTPLLGTPSTPGAVPDSASPLRWLPGSSWLSGQSSEATNSQADNATPGPSQPMRLKLQYAEAAAIRSRIMDEMLALEEERMERMRENRIGEGTLRMGDIGSAMKTAEDEGIIRRELSRADPSAVVFSESWAAKKSRIRQASPYGHLANWDCVSVIVKTGGDLRQEQLAVQLIQEFEKIWKDENCACWVRYFRILITGNSSGLVETITDAVSIHSIKKAEYARRLAEGRFGHITLYDHFTTTYGDPASAKFARAQRNFAKSLAGYSLVTYLLQIKDRHNGNILLDRDGHLIHIDFGFMLSNSPGNIGFEAAPFKLPLEYIAVLGGIDSQPFLEFKRLFKEGFEAARKHCDRIVTLVELMQKDSNLPCFTALGEGTAAQLRERFQQGLTQAAVEEHVQRLIDTSLGSNWTRLYDSYQYYSQSIL